MDIWIFGHNYRVGTLFTLYLTVLGIIIPSLKSRTDVQTDGLTLIIEKNYVLKKNKMDKKDYNIFLFNFLGSWQSRPAPPKKEVRLTFHHC